MVVSTVLVLGGVLAATPTMSASAAAVQPCSRGLVALTFDDGPQSIITPRLVELLSARRVPATFFVVGSRVRATPRITRVAWQRGFTIGNHTYGHEWLTRLSDAGIRRTLRRARAAIVDAGARPSTLMRPPYGAIDARVRRVVRGMGLVPVLWDVDPRDWDKRSAAAITSSTLSQLRPHERNIVLMHDGVANSGNTLRAVPRVISQARARGYCFAGLGPGGNPQPPVPRARVSDASAREAPGGTVMTAKVTLDRPTSRRTSVRVRTVARTATAGADYVAVDRRLDFPVGVQRRLVRVRVRDDLRDEPAERLHLVLSGARGLRLADARGVGTIHDDDPPPRVEVVDTEVVEPSTGDAQVPVTLQLSRASGHEVQVTVATRPGSADAADYVPVERTLRFAPGTTRAQLMVTVLADTVDETDETFLVRVTAGQHVDVTGAVGTVTVIEAN